MEHGIRCLGARLGWRRAVLAIMAGAVLMGAAAPELWSARSRSLMLIAGEYQVPAELAEGQAELTLALDPRRVFDERRDTIRADWEPFLRELAAQFQPGSGFRLVITGYGDRPATRYNPVLLGMRVKALQAYLAENGVALTWSKAGVAASTAYDGPPTMLDEACCGKVITLTVRAG